MACLTYRGRGLVTVLRTKRGSTKGGVQFAVSHPVPFAAYDAMVLWSRGHIDEVLGSGPGERACRGDGGERRD